jgi:SHS2 domain-containing protein
MKYKFIKHTADVKFQAFGKTLEECFLNSLEAMNEIITKDKIKENITKKIIIEAKDRERLLYDFLEEFLYLLDGTGFIIAKIENFKITTYKNKRGLYILKLVCDAIGDDIKNYNTLTQVKAVTFNEMYIKNEKNNGKDLFSCQVVLDV